MIASRLDLALVSVELTDETADNDHRTGLWNARGGTAQEEVRR